MKRFYHFIAIAVTSVVLSSCNMGTTNQTTTTSTSAALAGALLGATTNGNTTNSLISTGVNILSNLLGVNTVNANTIVGTWTYAEPQVTFESSNLLGQLGGQMVGSNIQSALKTQLEKIGLKAGLSKFTFDSMGNVTITLAKQTANGTYTLSGNQLTIKGALGIASFTSTVTINSNQLYMLFDANTIFNIITKLGSSSSSISSLLSNFNGMKMGWSLSR